MIFVIISFCFFMIDLCIRHLKIVYKKISFHVKSFLVYILRTKNLGHFIKTCKLVFVCFFLIVKFLIFHIYKNNYCSFSIF